MKMKNLPLSERPYEKFFQMGAASMSDAELLAIIIKSGTKDCSALSVAQQILTGKNGNLLNLYELPLEELLQYPGIGTIKGIQLKAVAELSRRMAGQTYRQRIAMNSPKSIADYFMESMRHAKREKVVGAFFDIKGKLVDAVTFSTGSSSFAFFPKQEILKKALLLNCSQFVVLHNHPSGDPNPSEDDINTTRRLQSAANCLDLTLIDHMIIGDRTYFSFFENDLL
ncbi:MAG: DNA repair protein RadC [Agathobacter sp.]|uniref:RadC family protein n=1 Tax=Agathobacter sp. TaxID=2021311 RepID=UPI00258F6EFF|nr:DNA repair protein RadC [Agathobacter sp.]MCR5677414.1 DNA repair protein RadC [Agathobacter sp.]